jgi:sortase A
MRTMEEPTTIDLTELEQAPVPEAHVRSGARLRRIVGIGAIGVAAFIGLFLVYLFGASRITEIRSQRLLLPEFRALTQQGPASVADWQPAPGQPVALLSIPSIGVEQIVVEGTSASDLTRGPGHYPGSPLPGRAGNSVIAGRRSAFGGPFRSIGTLQPGDTVEVATGQGAFTYTVGSVGSVMPGQADVIGGSTTNELTLVTSTPAYSASGRLVVVAKLTTAPAPGPAVVAPVVPQDQTGLTGEPAAAAPLLLWLEVLAAAGVAGVWYSRRVSPRVARLLMTPIVVALLWGIFALLARLLPATL